MDLYHIDESDVIMTINLEMSGAVSEENRRTVVNRDLSAKYGFPLKVVFAKKGRSIIVVSAYPVRKERGR